MNIDMAFSIVPSIKGGLKTESYPHLLHSAMPLGTTTKTNLEKKKTSLPTPFLPGKAKD